MREEMFTDVAAELLASGIAVRFLPCGHSMHPTIRDGEHVTVEPVKAAQVLRGDIILYLAPRGPIAHRVLKIKGEPTARTFITRGDSSTSSDAPVSASQILGRVIAVERNNRSHNLSARLPQVLDQARLRLSRLRARLWPHRPLTNHGTRAD